MKVDTHRPLDESIRQFKLSYPVTVALYNSDNHGQYIGIVPHGMIPDRLRVFRARPIHVDRPGWASHVVMLDEQDPWQMTRTLFHELTHAQQAEEHIRPLPTVSSEEHIGADLVALWATRSYGRYYENHKQELENQANKVSWNLVRQLERPLFT